MGGGGVVSARDLRAAVPGRVGVQFRYVPHRRVTERRQGRRLDRAPRGSVRVGCVGGAAGEPLGPLGRHRPEAPAAEDSPDARPEKFGAVRLAREEAPAGLARRSPRHRLGPLAQAPEVLLALGRPGALRRSRGAVLTIGALRLARRGAVVFASVVRPCLGIYRGRPRREPFSAAARREPTPRIHRRLVLSIGRFLASEGPRESLRPTARKKKQRRHDAPCPRPPRLRPRRHGTGLSLLADVGVHW
mmetsp:Transcript_4474/g.14845  ORF Transcript_4474/g.14845 Transcript_4474/m.14845 type:complete len:246 (+) Transcript_4474:102-839(+)